MKVQRIDIDKLTENEELFNNNHEESVRFSLEDLSKLKSKTEVAVPFNRNELIEEHFPVELDLASKLDIFDEENDLENDFNLTRMITDMQMRVLVETLKTAFATYSKTGSDESYDRVLSASYAIDSAKKSVLGAHKDKAKVIKDTDVKPTVNTTGTVNIQNNTFTGTPNDLLKMYGNALDKVEFEKNGNNE